MIVPRRDVRGVARVVLARRGPEVREPRAHVAGVEGGVDEVLEMPEEEAAEPRPRDHLLDVLVAGQRSRRRLREHEVPVPWNHFDAAVGHRRHVEVQIVRIADVRDGARRLRVDVPDAEERHHGERAHPAVDIHERLDGGLERRLLRRRAHGHRQGAAQLHEPRIVVAREVVEPAEPVPVLPAVGPEVRKVQLHHPAHAGGGQVLDALRIAGRDGAVGESQGGHADALQLELRALGSVGIEFVQPAVAEALHLHAGGADDVAAEADDVDDVVVVVRKAARGVDGVLDHDLVHARAPDAHGALRAAEEAIRRKCEALTGERAVAAAVHAAAEPDAAVVEDVALVVDDGAAAPAVAHHVHLTRQFGRVRGGRDDAEVLLVGDGAALAPLDEGAAGRSGCRPHGGRGHRRAVGRLHMKLHHRARRLRRNHPGVHAVRARRHRHADMGRPVHAVAQGHGAHAVRVGHPHGHGGRLPGLRHHGGVALHGEGGPDIRLPHGIPRTGRAALRRQIEEEGLRHLVVVEFRVQPRAAAQPASPQRDGVLPAIDHGHEGAARLQRSLQQVVHVEQRPAGAHRQHGIAGIGNDGGLVVIPQDPPQRCQGAAEGSVLDEFHARGRGHFAH